MLGYRRHWIVATLVIAVYGIQLVYGPQPWGGQQWVVPALIAVVVVAAAFAHHHVTATVFACAGILAVTILAPFPWKTGDLQYGGLAEPMRFDHGPLTVSEALAGMVLVVVLVWTATPLTAAICTAALFAVSVFSTYVRTVQYELPTAVPSVVLGTVAAVALGYLLRVRDRTQAQLAAAEEERVRREERLDMARELHDVVAHHVTGMLVQAQAAVIVSDGDKDAACGMLPGIVNGGTDALGAMRAMVRALRDAEATPGTSDLSADLKALVEKSGLPVRASIELPQDVRPELGRSVLRLVQEALTNTRKHAHDVTDVEVEVRLTATAVLLSVVDNGTTRPAHSGGFGLVGMKERVSELGGRFFAGATGDGWLVTAELPLAVHA
ncbi:histidine kinase [Lentzea sp. NPDC051838]|uniref:sensor histidine kinase n=1 Tax=Lentzea sp. NPDC051838 TaxID=3154849 RepID=UPI00343850AA